MRDEFLAWVSTYPKQPAWRDGSFKGAPAARTVTDAEIDKEAQALRQKLLEGPIRLAQIVANATALSKQIDPALIQAYQVRCQAEVDLTALGLALPIVPLVPAPPPPPPPPSPKPKPSSARSARGGSATRTVPQCPSCSSAMVQRTARKGRHAGRQFWGCSNYPRCTGTRAI